MSKLLLLSVNEDDIIDQILAFLDHGNRTYNLAEHTMEKKLIFDGIVIDIIHRFVYKEGIEIKLTHIEFEILLLLARHPGKIFTKESIYNTVWGIGYIFI